MDVARFARAVAAAALLTSTATTVAQEESCVTDDQPCPPSADTRTLGPPVVVQPVTGEVPAAAAADPMVDLPVPAAEPERLPPGPANRLP